MFQKPHRQAVTGIPYRRLRDVRDRGPSSAARIAPGGSARKRAEPSTSVNKKVTVPQGGGATTL
jgi:hypothetical protein